MDCQECGKCCSNKDQKWIEVTQEDAKQIPPELLQQGDISPWAMRMYEGSCVCLATMGGKMFCSIYEKRPAICRSVEQGSAICKESTTPGVQ